MFSRETLSRIFTAAGVAAALVLSGCGASPTAAPKSVKKTTPVAKAAPVAQAPAPVAPLATTPKAAAPAKTVATKPVVEEEVEEVVAEEPVEAEPTTTSKSIEISSEEGATKKPDPLGAISDELMGVLDASLSAEVVDQQNGKLFGMGQFKATIEVTNDSDTAQVGMLKVVFMNGDTESGTAPFMQTIALKAHSSKTVPVVDAKWSTDSCVASITPLTGSDKLGAFVVSTKNGTMLGMGTFAAEIEVVNPYNTPKTGTLVVVFHNGNKDSKTEPIRQAVSLAAGESQTFTFEDKKWSTDNVSVTVE